MQRSAHRLLRCPTITLSLSQTIVIWEARQAPDDLSPKQKSPPSLSFLGPFLPHLGSATLRHRTLSATSPCRCLELLLDPAQGRCHPASLLPRYRSATYHSVAALPSGAAPHCVFPVASNASIAACAAVFWAAAFHPESLRDSGHCR